MTHCESAIDPIAERVQGTDASLTTSIAGIWAAAMQELIEAELTGTFGADHVERTPNQVGATQRTPAQAALDAGGGPWTSASRSCARAAYFLSCSSRAGGSTRPCGR
jgi:hypothetical protein